MDRRDYMNGRRRVDHAAAIARGYLTVKLYDDETDELVEEKLPCVAEVCGTCDGKGTHVNPSIDAHGITQEEFSQWDEDEVEGYFSGRYDVTCYECSGNKVVAVPADEGRMKPAEVEVLRRWESAQRDEAAYEAECAAERRMGC